MSYNSVKFQIENDDDDFDEYDNKLEKKNEFSYKFEQFSITFQKYLPLALVFFSGFGFSIQSLFIKLLKISGFEASFEMIFVRGVIQLSLASIHIYSVPLDPKNKENTGMYGGTLRIALILFFRALAGFGGISFSFLGVERLPIGDNTVLVMMSPLIASILSYFILGEKWKIPDVFSLMIAIIGCSFVARPTFLFGNDDNELTKPDPIGVMFALTGALCAGSAYVSVRMLGTVAKMPWDVICFWQACGQIFLSIPSLYISGQELILNPSGYQISLIIFGGLIGAISQIAMTLGMQREKSTTATGMRLSDVLFGFIWESLFTNDTVNSLSLFGATLIICSILLLVYFKEQLKPSQISNKDEKNIDDTSLILEEEGGGGGVDEIFDGVELIVTKNNKGRYEKISQEADDSVNSSSSLNNPLNKKLRLRSGSGESGST
jgi:drug/metabolite transporter (DMT)-like permease